MTSAAIDQQDFPFGDEQRPETSKCSRGVASKFNKTQSGFHQQDNFNGSGATINDPYSGSHNNNSNAPNNNASEFNSQRIIMNSTGFSFKQQKLQDGNKYSNVESIKIEKVIKPPTSSQGRRQNSFSSGITLEQYFQNPSEVQDDARAQSPQFAGGQKDIPQAKRLAQQSYELSDMKVVDEHFPQSRMKDQAHNESNEGQFKEEDFEIHEASDEEEEEEDYTDVKKIRRRQAEQLIDNDSGKENQKEIDFKREKGQKSAVKPLKKDNSNNMSNNVNKNIGDNEAKGYHQVEAEEEEKNVESEEMQMQKKIRDKYKKKTIIHKQYIATPSQNNNNSNSNKSQSSSSQMQQQQYQQHSQSQQQQQQYNNGQSHSSTLNNNSNNSQQQSIQSNQSSNQNNYYSSHHPTGYLNNGNDDEEQEDDDDEDRNQQQNQQQSSIATGSGNGKGSSNLNQQSSYQYNFGINNNLVPNSYNYSSNAGRKANRSESPLQSFKRQSNLGHSQQRRVSRQTQDRNNSPPVIDEMRHTFNNTSRNKNGFNTFQQQQQMESTFRGSFYSKPLQSNQYNQQQQYQQQQQQQQQYCNQSKQRLTVNDFYKSSTNNNNNNNNNNNSLYENKQQQLQQQMNQQNNSAFNSTLSNFNSTNYNSGNGNNYSNFHNISNSNKNPEYIADVVMMRRTAKENKFMNQKDKIQEAAKEDVNFITKHAARFNLNPQEIAQIRLKN